jgi:uracil-DNA glycosylase
MNATATTDYNGWQQVLGQEKEAEYFQKAMQFVKEQRARGKTVYPAQQEIFNALKLTPFNQIKVVILGQDPYHGPNQAHGLCFSVRSHVAMPPSLKNIFQEIYDDLGLPIPSHGCLENWARQGVLLLNAVLTVEAGRAHSHANIGWETFTDRVIQAINDHREGIIFLLWGAQAQRKGRIIDPSKHYVLKAPHPSPLSAHRGFFGCQHFSTTNELLRQMGREPIDWSVDETS